MKKSAIAGLAALTLLDISAATPANAQGAPNPFVGTYVGAHAGVFTGDANFQSTPYIFVGLGDTLPFPGRNDSFDFDGLLVGPHGGINFLLGPNLVGGFEGGWSWLGESDTVFASGTGTGTTNTDGFAFQRRSELELQWQGTIRGRLGVVNGNTYFFLTGGIAFLNLDWDEIATITNTTTSTSLTFNHSGSDTLVGGVVGAGVDIAITPTVFLGADYLYENFGNSDSLPHGFGTGLTGKVDDLDIHKVRVRVSVKLGGGAP